MDNSRFYSSKRNRRGIVVLAVLALIITLLPRFIHWLKEPYQIDIQISELIEDIDERQNESKLLKGKFDFKKKSKFKRPHSKFDPNSYTSEQWMYLGLSEKQANVVVKFTKRKIYSNEELQRIFVISDQLFQLIKDSTYYPQKFSKSEFAIAEADAKGKKNLIVDLNISSEEELIQLKGIGPYFSKKIIEYREKLGGFIRKEQLLEVWNFDQEKYAKIEESVLVDPRSVKKMNLNSITAEELKTHPYISWNVANSIVKMRENKGAYQSIEQIKESHLISEDLFVKLKPYLSL